jgi:superfamily II DNA or RNA helicase
LAVYQYKNKQMAYIGPKGYTILKNTLTPQQEKKIKKDLTIKPFSMMAGKIGFAGGAHEVSYPVYRENQKKLYIPQYYGKEHFGIPSHYKLSEGVDINIEFNGQLRDYQQPVIELAIKYFNSEPVSAGLLELPCAWGKTGGSLYLVSALKKKTLVIVHKEFLMNQWIERIQQFLPTARIGRIQGPIIDIDDKDIVLCMLQSLSMKEYPNEMFDTFGFTIVDEVHHISSQTFSCALFKVVTKYMLGLSATLNRKDGTTPVIKMFLGNVIYKGKREANTNVGVRAYYYKTTDSEFNETLYDGRGNPAYSSMIVKLCEYNRRSEFILGILQDIYIENPNQQIMILAHNKSLLKYLYESVETRGICEGSVGYYVGGMKESSLKESEKKKVIIATYAMAAEALDIKTLTTLIMATPKTDIEQAVGRILREKHSRPLIIDIVDSHGLFRNQWKKRKTYYNKNNYSITEYNENKQTMCSGNKKKKKSEDNLEEEEEEYYDEDDDSTDSGSIKGVCLL